MHELVKSDSVHKSDKKDPIYSTLIAKKNNKVDTAVGTTSNGSIKEIRHVSDGSVQTYDFVEFKSDKKSDIRTSIGTSPPPQSMATQVTYYEYISIVPGSGFE